MNNMKKLNDLASEIPSREINGTIIKDDIYSTWLGKLSTNELQYREQELVRFLQDPFVNDGSNEEAIQILQKIQQKIKSRSETSLKIIAICETVLSKVGCFLKMIMVEKFENYY